MGQGLVRQFKRVDVRDCERLVEWLPKQSYPYHSLSRVDIAWVRDRIADGCFFGGDTRCFWALDEGGSELALVRVCDVEDITPLIDLRVAEHARGKGVGTVALRYATRFVFENLPEITRIGGYTRHDNGAMRRVFDKCGYLQEAYHRGSWRVEGAPLADSVGYAILRSEWRPLSLIS